MVSGVGQAQPEALTAYILTFGPPETRPEMGGRRTGPSSYNNSPCMEAPLPCPAWLPQHRELRPREASSHLGAELGSNSGLLLPFPISSPTAHPKAWPLQPCLAYLPSPFLGYL